MTLLPILPAVECQWDAISLGEVLLRFDPGAGRIGAVREFRVWEGGGEYNVIRALSHCFGHRTSIVSALVDNAIGHIVEDMIRAGGVSTAHLQWKSFDGLGIEARNGIYLLERGFGVRGALGCMDRGHTAVSQMTRGSVDWDAIFAGGVRWFHTGGIYSALSESTYAVVQEAMQAAKVAGAIVSYDCNYRPSLWAARGGRGAAARANRALMPYVDVFFGHEADIASELDENSNRPPDHTPGSYTAMAERVLNSYSNLKAIVTPTRRPVTASRNDWGGFAYAQGVLYEAPVMHALDVLDRVGSGDAFAAGVIHGLLNEKPLDWSLRCGLAAGAHTMTTEGDSCQASLREIEHLMANAGAGVQR